MDNAPTSTSSPYESGAGDSLIDEDLFPASILDFRSKERDAITSLLEESNWEVLIEVGCMEGLHTAMALRAGMEYVGVDIVQRYITGARKVWGLAPTEQRERVRFVHCDAANVDELDVGGKSAVSYFPFNSLGNMSSPEAAINANSRLGADGIITTYETNGEATRDRIEYYRACGFTNLTVEESAQGVRIRGSSGLSTIAYRESFVSSLAGGKYKEPAKVHFAPFGVIYLLRNEYERSYSNRR